MTSSNICHVTPSAGRKQTYELWLCMKAYFLQPSMGKFYFLERESMYIRVYIQYLSITINKFELHNYVALSTATYFDKTYR